MIFQPDDKDKKKNNFDINDIDNTKEGPTKP